MSSVIHTFSHAFLASLPYNRHVQGGPAKVRPTLLVTFECVGKIIVVQYELYELYDWGKVTELYGTLQ